MKAWLIGGFLMFVFLLVIATAWNRNVPTRANRAENLSELPDPVDQQTLVCMNAWYWATDKPASELTVQQMDVIDACKTLGRLTRSGKPEP